MSSLPLILYPCVVCAQCVDEWLRVNASCPTCRLSILAGSEGSIRVERVATHTATVANHSIHYERVPHGDNHTNTHTHGSGRRTGNNNNNSNNNNNNNNNSSGRGQGQGQGLMQAQEAIPVSPGRGSNYNV